MDGGAIYWDGESMEDEQVWEGKKSKILYLLCSIWDDYENVLRWQIVWICSLREGSGL